MARFIKTIFFVVFFIVIIEAVSLLVFSVCRDDRGMIEFGDQYLLPITDDRMGSYFSKGDMVVVMKVNSEQILANSVISYLDSDQVIRMGRVSSIIPNKNSYQFELTFDGNDDTTIIDSSSVLGLWSTTKIPFLGYFLSFLFSQNGILLGIFFPLFLVFMFEFGQLLFFLRKDFSKKKVSV